MENIKKKVIITIIVSVVCFLLGLVVNQFFLSKYFDFSKQNEEMVQKEVVDIASEEKNTDKKLQLEESCNTYVDVSGAVKEPGVYCLHRYALVIDAISKAGGFSKGVAMEYVSRNINLSLQLKEYQKIYIPYEKEVKCELQSFQPYTGENSSEETSSSTTNTTENNDNSKGEVQCVNINTASKTELTTLNGIGESTAEKIIQGRPYQKIEDLLNVSGIGEATWNKFKENICI